MMRCNVPSQYDYMKALKQRLDDKKNPFMCVQNVKYE